MVQEAEANKEQDEKRKELIEAKNQADALVHQTEKTLSEAGDKITNDDKVKVEKALNELKEVLKNENVTKEQIDEKVKALTEVSHSLAQAMYADQQAGANPGANPNSAQNNSGKKADDDVIDAEVE